MFTHRRTLYRFVNAFSINTRNLLQNSINQNRYSMITYHTIVICTPELPDRKIAVRVILPQHTFNKVGHTLLFQKRIHRMAGPECIPKRERTVMSFSIFCSSRCVICKHKFAINVRNSIGLNIRMVKPCVENSLLIVCSLNTDIA